MINFIFIALVTIAALLAVRFVVHRFYHGWGTTWTGIIGMVMALVDRMTDGLPALLTDLSGLPWAKIMAADTANAVVFGFAAALTILRNIPRKGA
jgi:hypothetical protein